MGKTFNKDTVGLCIPISAWMTFQGRRTICCSLQQDENVDNISTFSFVSVYFKPGGMRVTHP